MRICVGLALLSDQLIQYLPELDEFFGPHGIAFAGLHDLSQMRRWRWTLLLFNQDAPAVIYSIFATWLVVTLLFTLGYWTRPMNVAVWLLTMCFINRNPNILNGGDDTLQAALFLLMLAPSGKALSVDAWLLRRRGLIVPVYTVAWPVRLVQIQLCLIYCTTGLSKLKGDGWGTFQGTWWDGTSIHNALNFIFLTRWSFAQLPLPFWMTAVLTYTCVWWETLFPLLVLWRRTRPWALWFGVSFHLGIFLTMEVGWFSIYSLCFYAVWIPDWVFGESVVPSP